MDVAALARPLVPRLSQKPFIRPAPPIPAAPDRVTLEGGAGVPAVSCPAATPLEAAAKVTAAVAGSLGMLPGAPLPQANSTLEAPVQFAPVTLAVNTAELSPSERMVLKHVIRAGKQLDDIFWRQTWSGSAALRDSMTASGDARLDRVLLMAGPYDRLEEHAPFVEGVPPKPLGAGFYPDDIKRQEFEAWIASHPRDREAFESTTTLIRRQDDTLVAVPYHQAYRPQLEAAAQELHMAARASDNPSLAKFLHSRADAFQSDDYFQSDMDWMDVKDSKVDVTIGPYETYEDLMFGYKAAYEAYVGVTDAGETANLEVYSRHLDAMDQKLAAVSPYTIHRGASSPLRVINVVSNAGQARHGVQTAAFNLPNDERVHQAKGTRKVMLRNVSQAKFDHCMLPIAERLLEPRDVATVKFESFFTNVLLHEMAHSLGPSFLPVAGTEATTVRKALQELHSPVEEAKADIVGLMFHQHLMDGGILPPSNERSVYSSFVAGIFRSIRFGVAEAHGKANIVELNFLRERGAVRYDRERGKFSIDFDRIKPATEELAHRLVGIEARGSYSEAKAMLDRYGTVDADLKSALERLHGVPVDIRPQFPLEHEANLDG